MQYKCQVWWLQLKMHSQQKIVKSCITKIKHRKQNEYILFRNVMMSSISGKSLGVIMVSTFSSIKMLKMHDVIDSANPNQPINKPVVYKSKQKNFRSMVYHWLRSIHQLLWFFSSKIVFSQLLFMSHEQCKMEKPAAQFNKREEEMH